MKVRGAETKDVQEKGNNNIHFDNVGFFIDLRINTVILSLTLFLI